MKKYYWIVYAAIIAVIVVALLVFPDMGDMGQMILYATAIILTSVFLYSTRKKR